MRRGESWGFGMVCTLAAREPHAHLVTLSAHLSRAAGTPFHAHDAPSYPELTGAMAGGVLGLAWVPPIVAIDLVDRGVASPLVLPMRGGGTTFHTAIFARRGRPRTLAELKGLRVAWVDRSSAAGYLVPRIHLASQGFDLATFFSQELFLNDHFAVVEAVAAGRADLGAGFCNLDPVTQRVVSAAWTTPDGVSLRALDVVATAGPIPSDAIMVATGLPADVRARITRFFLNLDAASRAETRGLLRAESFRVATSSHFDPLRHMLRAARARGYRESEPPRRGVER